MLVGCGWPLAQPRTHTSPSAPSQTRGHTGARGQHPWHAGVGCAACPDPCRAARGGGHGQAPPEGAYPSR